MRARPMRSINQNHVLGRSESNCNQRTRSMPLHRGLSSLSDATMLGRSEQYRDNTFLRNSAGVTANLGATPCHPPSCRHSCRSNTEFRTLGHFHERVLVHDEHTAGAPRVVNRSQVPIQRRGVIESAIQSAIQSACSCGGHGRERCEESEVQAVEENRYHRGASMPDTQAGHVHSHPVDDCGCCCLSQPKIHLGRDEGEDSIDDRKTGAAVSPCFPSSEDFARRATANGFMSKLPSTSRKATTIASRTDSTSVANVLVPPQVSRDQVILYGWFLKRPTSCNNTPACSTVPQVAIGGYKSAGMLESEYYESGPIVQRLERWRLRTRGGVDVGIMGRINDAKSVENGFPIALAQCFMIGFPSSWIYLISNFSSETPKGCSLDPPLSSPSASNAHRQTQETKEYGREVPLTTASLEADPVRIVLSSPLFLSPEDTRFRSVRRVSSTNNVSLRSGIVSDATLVPQSNISQDADKSRNDRDSRCGACNSGNHSVLCELKPAVASESPVEEDVVPGAGREQEATLGNGMPGSGNPAVAKGESCREGGVAVVNTPSTSLNEQAQNNDDREQFRGDGKPKGQEDETRNGAFDEVNTLQDDGVVRETVCKKCTRAHDCADSKMSCPCSGEVGLDNVRSSAGDSQGRENKADVHAESSSFEELSNKEDEIAKQCALVSEETSDTTRKRPFQELNAEEEVERRTKVIRATNSTSRIRTRSSIGGKTGGLSPDPLTSGLVIDSIPCTPLQESKKRPRSATETLCPCEEVRDEGLIKYNSAEPVLGAGGTGPVEEDTTRDVTGDVFAGAEDLNTDEPEDRERQEKTAGQDHVSVEADPDFRVEPIVSPVPNARADEVIAAPKDLIGDASETRRRSRKVEGNAASCGEPKASVEENVDSGAELKDGALVDVQKGQTMIPPENQELPVKVTSRRRRRVAVISPSSQSGDEFKTAPGVDEIVVVGSVGVGKGSDEVVELGQELADVPETEHLFTEEAKDVHTTGSRKYQRKPKVKYYESRRRKYTRRANFAAEESLDHKSDPGSGGLRAEEPSTEAQRGLQDSKATGRGKCSEDDTDTGKEVPAPVRRRNQRRATRNYYKPRRRKSHGRDNQSIGDGPRDGVSSESRRDLEELDDVVTSSTRRRKMSDVSSSLAIKPPSNRRVPQIPFKQGSKGRSPGKKVKPKTSIVLPRPPSPRAADKTNVPEAFGLKKSRHGRVLVPRLATWRNQSIKYDMDGSIIAIVEGFQGAEEEFGTGCYNFRPPSGKEAVSMQRKLREAAELV